MERKEGLMILLSYLRTKRCLTPCPRFLKGAKSGEKTYQNSFYSGNLPKILAVLNIGSSSIISKLLLMYQVETSTPPTAPKGHNPRPNPSASISSPHSHEACCVDAHCSTPWWDKKGSLHQPGGPGGGQWGGPEGPEEEGGLTGWNISKHYYKSDTPPLVTCLKMAPKVKILSKQVIQKSNPKNST